MTSNNPGTITLKYAKLLALLFARSSTIPPNVREVMSKVPVGIWCQNDVVSMSMRRHHVASTLILRRFTSLGRKLKPFNPLFSF